MTVRGWTFLKTSTPDILKCPPRMKRTAKPCGFEGSFLGRISRRFVISAGVLLWVTGAAKVLSLLGEARVLHVPDPIFGLSFASLMLLVGLVELVIGSRCLFSKHAIQSIGLVASLATSFVAYRAGLWLMHWKKPCNCLGSLTDAIHLSPRLAEQLAISILVYLFAGSYLLLTAFFLARGRLSSNSGSGARGASENAGCSSA